MFNMFKKRDRHIPAPERKYGLYAYSFYFFSVLTWLVFVLPVTFVLYEIFFEGFATGAAKLWGEKYGLPPELAAIRKFFFASIVALVMAFMFVGAKEKYEENKDEFFDDIVTLVFWGVVLSVVVSIARCVEG